MGAIQLLREEVFLMVSSGCLVNSQVAVVVRLLRGRDIVQQTDRNAMNTRQLPHDRRVFLPDRGYRRLVVPHQHQIDLLSDELLQEELGGQEL